ncbi:LacI family DNA-binding transcriptional regulator [Microbacterium sp. NPDC089320]|uniref:LacI family DNA-binding transcriptional regulator n=1 Tax=Microbacterium sp. NPDC089320 TaxID=3155182 RepID=UPI003446D940
MTDTDGGRPARTKRATIVDVARHAGVSTASASKVLRNAYGVSDAMKERVQASMEALEYRPHRPARGMRGRTYTVGMMVSDIDNPYFSLIADGLASVLRPSDYELLVSPGGYDAASQNQAIEALIDHQMDGLILVAPLVSPADLERVSGEIPVVVVGSHTASPSVDSVSGDDQLGSRLVVDHLVALGHRRIGFVANHQVAAESHRPESVRLAGFLEAMAQHDLSDEAVVIDTQWSLEGGRDAVRLIDALDNPPSAVFAGADITALGMMSELWEGSRSAPDAYSLAGYDNSRIASIGPIGLTTVDQSGHEVGASAGRLLLERIGGRGEASHLLLRPELVVRTTTAPPTPRAL